MRFIGWYISKMRAQYHASLPTGMRATGNHAWFVLNFLDCPSSLALKCCIRTFDGAATISLRVRAMHAPTERVDPITLIAEAP